MSSRIQNDTVIDDDDESWYATLAKQSSVIVQEFLKLIFFSPLCIEEFDLSDKNFKPCPCGYQVRVPMPL